MDEIKPEKAEKAQKAPKPEKAEKAEGEIYVLERNFGTIINREHKLWMAGEEFDAEKDHELIAMFHREGAAISLKK